MSTSTPSRPAPAGAQPTLPLYLSAAVSAVVVVGLIVLLGVGKTTWAEVGPIITVLAGGHFGAGLALTATRQ